MTDAIRYALGEIPALEQLSGLYKSVSWSQADCPDDLHKAVEHSQWVATAWHAEQLVGMSRVLTDGVFIACLQDFVVHPEYRHQGIGKELLNMFDETFGEFHQQFAMVDSDWAKTKFEKRGFHTEPAAVSRTRPLSVCP